MTSHYKQYEIFNVLVTTELMMQNSNSGKIAYNVNNIIEMILDATIWKISMHSYYSKLSWYLVKIISMIPWLIEYR